MGKVGNKHNALKSTIGALALSITLVGSASAYDKPLTHECLIHAAKSYGIDPTILYAILMVEGGANHVIGKNSNGTNDLGYFQINDINADVLKKEFGITKEELLSDGCLNAAVAARHLLISISDVKEEIKTYDDYLAAIARYHSKTPKHNEAYRKKLALALEKIYQE